MTEITITKKATARTNEESIKRRANAKPVYCLETQEIYASVTDAAYAFGVNKSWISTVCLGKRKSMSGFHLCFVADIPRNLNLINGYGRDNMCKANLFEAIEKEINTMETMTTNIVPNEENIQKTVELFKRIMNMMSKFMPALTA